MRFNFFFKTNDKMKLYYSYKIYFFGGNPNHYDKQIFAIAIDAIDEFIYNKRTLRCKS